MMQFRIFILALFLLGILSSQAEFRVNTTTHMIVDELNRQRFFHGVNVVYKKPPWIPRTDVFTVHDSFSQEDIDSLQEWGLNIIRLGTQWPGAEPNKGEYDWGYYEKLKGIVEASGKQNIYTLLDFHQDSLNPMFCGEGIPDWAVRTAFTARKFPFPLQLKGYKRDPITKYPSDQDCARHGWASYQFTEEAASAYQSLYNNKDGIGNDFAKFWATTAGFFKTNKYVLGYEIINEPWAGNIFRNPLLIVPHFADRLNLARFYNRVAKEIRKVDDEKLIFFESVTWDDFIPVGFPQVPGGKQYQNRSVLSYHAYNQINFNANLQLKSRNKDIKRLGCGGMMTEFNLWQEDYLETADKFQQSWIGWTYQSYGNITGDHNPVYNETAAQEEVIATISRTYPQAVAGVTNSFAYNSTTQDFVLQYQICSSCGETQIYLNEKIHYPNGFTVSLNSELENQVSWNQPQKNMIFISHTSESNNKILIVKIQKK